MNKILYLIILFMVSTTIFGTKELPVMLKVKANFNLSSDIVDTFRSGSEDALTAQGYVLISKQQQEEALKAQAEQQNSDCYDDACLVDTGKMMAAQMIFIVDVRKLENEYVFKARLVDLETGSTKRTVTKVYKGRLSSASELLKFSKKLTNEALGVDKEKLVETFSNINPSDLIKIIVSTNPSGASIYIDDKFIGKSPAQAKIAKGKHNFKIVMKNYEDHLFEKELYMDKEENINLKETYYRIFVKTEPSDAIVSYAGRNKGFSNLFLSIPGSDLNNNSSIKYIKVSKKGYYEKAIKVKTINPKKSSVLNVKLKEIPQNNILFTVNEKDVDLIVNYRNCSVSKINDYNFRVTGYKGFNCDISFVKKYFATEYFSTDFHKSRKRNINLKEFKKYKLNINTYPNDAKIIVKNNDTEDEFILKSGITKVLYEGKYSYELIKDKYSMNSDLNLNILLDEDKTIKHDMTVNDIHFLKPYGLMDVNMGAELLYLNFGVGLDLFTWTNDKSIKTLGATFNQNITDNYYSLDFYFNWKGELLKNMYLGVDVSILGNTDRMTFMFGVLAEYQYIIMNQFFVKTKLETGLNSFNSNINGSDVKDSLYFIAGISIGWNGF